MGNNPSLSWYGWNEREAIEKLKILQKQKDMKTVYGSLWNNDWLSQNLSEETLFLYLLQHHFIRSKFRQYCWFQIG